MFFVVSHKVYSDSLLDFHGFASGTFGVLATREVDPYIGGIGYLGCSFNFDDDKSERTGLGFYFSREKGTVTVSRTKFDSDIAVIALAISVNWDDTSMLIASGGISAGVVSLGGKGRAGAGEILSLQYIRRLSDPLGGISVNGISGFRTQGQGVMFYVGVGIGFW